MSTTPTITTIQRLAYRYGSVVPLVASGLTDGNGNPLTGATASLKLTLTDKFSGAVLGGLNATAGGSVSAGTAQYNIPASALATFGQVAFAALGVYDAGGTVLNRTLHYLLMPAAIPSGTYVQGGTMVLGLPVSGAQPTGWTSYDGTQRTNSNGQGTVTVIDRDTGVALLAATGLNYTAGVGWTYNWSVPTYVQPPRMLVRYVMSDLTPTQLDTFEEYLYDGG